MNRRGIQHDPRALPFGIIDDQLVGVLIDLQLGQQNFRAGKQGLNLLHVVPGKGFAGARRDGNSVLAGSFIHENQRVSGLGLRGNENMLRRKPDFFILVVKHLGKSISAHLGHHGDVPPGKLAGHRLVASLAARPHSEQRAFDGFPGNRNMGGTGHEVYNEASEYDNV